MANVLAHARVTGPGGRPLPEAVAFGVMGGLGAGYILWEFEHDDSRAVTLGFRNQWQYLDRGVRTADRLEIPYAARTTPARARRPGTSTRSSTRGVRRPSRCPRGTGGAG